MDSANSIRSWLSEHEKLILALIAAGVVYLGYIRVTDIIAAHDASQLKQAQVTAAQQAAQDALLAQQVQTDKAQLQALADKVTEQNAQLIAANVALATALSKQQSTDANLPPTELALRWGEITPNMPAGGITLNSQNSMVVTQAGAVATVQQLEKVPALTQELANATTQKQNDDQLLSASNKSILDLLQQVGGLQKQVTDNNSACQEQIQVVKSQAAKSKRHWFIVGYVLGFLSRQFIGNGY